jgi:CRP/FNR family transcriptional regulator
VGSYALDFQLTHEDLGFLVGAHRVSVTRMMKRLKASGRIDSEGKLYIVHSSAETDLGSH